jgi:hypothetical protein
MEKMAMTPVWRNSQELSQEAENLLAILQEFFKDLGKLKKKE